MADEITPTPQTDAQLVASLGWTPVPEDAPEQAEVTSIEKGVGLGTPAPTSTVTTQTVTTPTEPDELVQARAQLRSEQAQLRINNAALQYKEQLRRGGMDDDQAQMQAEQAAGLYWANFQRDSALDTANEMAKNKLVQELAQEHGIPTDMLQGFNDPSSMRAAAKIYGSQGKELAGLKAQMAKPKTPAQNYDGGAGSAHNSRDAARAAYHAGGPSLTAAEFQAKFGYDPR